jgi:hypothetical protein
MNKPYLLQHLSILEKFSAGAAALLTPPPTPAPLINRTLEEQTEGTSLESAVGRGFPGTAVAFG